MLATLLSPWRKERRGKFCLVLEFFAPFPVHKYLIAKTSFPLSLSLSLSLSLETLLFIAFLAFAVSDASASRFLRDKAISEEYERETELQRVFQQRLSQVSQITLNATMKTRRCAIYHTLAFPRASPRVSSLLSAFNAPERACSRRRARYSERNIPITRWPQRYAAGGNDVSSTPDEGKIPRAGGFISSRDCIVRLAI